MYEKSIKEFIKSLCDLWDSKNKAALAHLRLGLRKKPRMEYKVFPYVIPHVKHWLDNKKYANQINAFFIVASLFALHPKNSESGNMGTVFRQIFEMRHKSPSIEQRFVQLLNSHPDDLPTRLRHAISLAKSDNVHVHYSQLLRDLLFWNCESRRVQQKWAKEFWGSATGDNQSNDNDE